MRTEQFRSCCLPRQGRAEAKATPADASANAPASLIPSPQKEYDGPATVRPGLVKSFFRRQPAVTSSQPNQAAFPPGPGHQPTRKPSDFRAAQICGNLPRVSRKTPSP